MNPQPHAERALIQRLLEDGNLSPEQWDRVFSHVRGCDSCAEYYAEVRADLGTAKPGEMTATEQGAMRRVLIARAEAMQLPWPQRALRSLRAHPAQFGAFLASAVAVLLWVVPHDGPGGSRPLPADGPSARSRGSELTPQLEVRCAPSGESSDLKPLDATGCPSGGLLEFRGFTPASLAARAFVVVVVDQQLELLEYGWAEPVSDNTSSVQITVARNGKVRAFVSWTRAPQAKKAVQQALNELRQSPQRGTLALPGALAQRSLTIDLQAEHDR